MPLDYLGFGVVCGWGGGGAVGLVPLDYLGFGVVCGWGEIGKEPWRSVGASEVGASEVVGLLGGSWEAPGSVAAVSGAD